MHTLALETATRTAGLALWRNDALVASRQLPDNARTNGWLAAETRALLVEFDIRPTDLGLIALDQGPGSFTGLRIGVTFAKVLTFACRNLTNVSGQAASQPGQEGKPAGIPQEIIESEPTPVIVGLDTLEVIAFQAMGAAADAATIHAVMDAGRGELFYGAFQAGANGVRRIEASRIVEPAELNNLIAPADLVTGPGLGIIDCPQHFQQAAQSIWQPSATAIGQLALQRYAEGYRSELWGLKPMYLRKSYADEKRGQA